jgi:hypothetical protein
MRYRRTNPGKETSSSSKYETAAREIGVKAKVRWTFFTEAEQYRQSVSKREPANQPVLTSS